MPLCNRVGCMLYLKIFQSYDDKIDALQIYAINILKIVSKFDEKWHLSFSNWENYK